MLVLQHPVGSLRRHQPVRHLLLFCLPKVLRCTDSERLLLARLRLKSRVDVLQIADQAEQV